MVAQLTRHTDDEEWICQIIQTGLPEDYRGDTVPQLPEMIRSALAKGFGENKRGAGAVLESMASEATKLALQNSLELFHDGNERSFITINATSGGLRTISLSSLSMSKWLQGLWYAERGKPLPAKPLGEAIAALSAKALYAGEKHSVSVRIGSDGNAIYIDLGDADFSVIQVTATSWSVVATAPIKFIRSKTMRPLPVPLRGGSWDDLQDLLRLPELQWRLVQAFIVGCFRPQGPYFCLLVNGEQGSGKSLLCTILKRLIDPSLVDRLSLPKSDEQLFIQAKDEHLLVFDNASWVNNDISDALCRLATGGAIAKRALYTDDDLHVLSSCIPFIINGIGEYSNRPDLLERAILLTLPSMSDDARLTEQEIFQRFDENLSQILGCILDAVSLALRSEAETTLPKRLRMADAARWLSAAEPALGLKKSTLLEAIEESQVIAVADRIRDNSLYRALHQLLEENGPYEGGMGALHDFLLLKNDRPDRSFPRTAAHLSSQLQRLAPAMAKAGIAVELQQRGREGRTVVIQRTPGEERPVRMPKSPSY
jgi:hypothetical protein